MLEINGTVFILSSNCCASFVGRMRCLAALARWEELNNLCREYWTPAEPAARLEMAPMVGDFFFTLFCE